MRILGIDFGLKKIGLAVSTGLLTEPYRVIRFKKKQQVYRQIKKVIENEKITKIVVGESEGKSGQRAREFGDSLSKYLNVEVYYQDETLTTKEAQRLAIDAGIKRKKRKGMEDAYSAALILQAYLEKQIVSTR